MGAVSIADILLTPLKRIAVAGGDVLHALKKSDAGFVDFGEVYFSLVENGAIKAWKRHRRMTLNLVMPIGAAKFVFMDHSKQVREEIIGASRYMRVTVPPGIWFGFQGLSEPYGLLMNLADIQHDPQEVERRDVVDMDYEWGMTK
jgi:dTDP-4-dehydrorhamnose 3,5-epimerase